MLQCTMTADVAAKESVIRQLVSRCEGLEEELLQEDEAEDEWARMFLDLAAAMGLTYAKAEGKVAMYRSKKVSP